MKKLIARRIIFFIEHSYGQEVIFYTVPEIIDDIELDEMCLDMAENYEDDEDMYSSGYWEEYDPKIHKQYADMKFPIWETY